MKKRVSVLLTAAILFITSLPLIAAAQGEIMINNDYSIVYGSDEKLKPIADVMAGYLSEQQGLTLPVTAGDAEPCIRLAIDPSAAGDGYKIEAQGKNVVISGSNFQQTISGIFYFLEEYAGIYRYTKDLVVCTKDSVSVPADLSFCYTPYFEYRETDWLSPCDPDYALYNGINGGDYRTIPDELGGNVDYISGFGHTLTNQFCSSSKYFDEHPEYFALSFGRRTPKQLCLSNPEVYEIVRDEVMALLKEKHDPDADLQIVSLTQHDNISYCTCKKCHEIDKKYGSHAGTMLEFVNAIARDVKAAGYNNVAIDTFAYRYTRTPPKGIVPEDNVIVRLCSIECCFSHTMDDPTCACNVSFMKDLAGWSEICNRLYIWDYTTNYACFVGLFPDFGTLQRNMQVFYENGVKGVYEEGNYTLDVCDTEFAELRAYLIAKLMQNPYRDYKQTRDGFLNAFYGAGGEYIGEFLDIVTNNASTKHLSIYEGMNNTLNLTNKQVKACDELWEKAKAAADGTAKQNVLNSELCWRTWKSGNRASEFANPIKAKEEKSRLDSDLTATGIKRRSEMDGFKLFILPVWERIRNVILPVYNLILKLLYAV